MNKNPERIPRAFIDRGTAILAIQRLIDAEKGDK